MTETEFFILFGIYSLICSFVAEGIYGKDLAGFFLGLIFGVFGIITAAILSLSPTYLAFRKKYEEDKEKEIILQNEVEENRRLEELQRQNTEAKIQKQTADLILREKQLKNKLKERNINVR